MDQVLADTLTANLKAAHTPEAKQDALILAMIAVVDCQRKISARAVPCVKDGVPCIYDNVGKRFLYPVVGNQLVAGPRI